MADGRTDESKDPKDPRFKVRPRRVNPPPPKPDDTGELPQSKVPAAVAVPIPVPVGGDGAAQSRYRVNPNFQFAQAPYAQHGFNFDTKKLPTLDSVPPMPTAPAPGSAPAVDSSEPPEMRTLRTAEASLASERAAVPKKEKWWKSGLKMLAYGARDMPPARDWGEFAYGAGRSLGSGAAGIAKHDLPGQIQKRYRVAQAEDSLEQAQKTASVASQIQGRADAQKVRVARLNRDLSKDEYQQEKDKRKAVADDLRRLPYIDPSNPAHAAILERAKAAGIEVDPESFGKGRNRPRIRVLDDDGVTEHWFEKDPQRGWVPVRIEGRDAIASLTEKRNPLTGETYSSAERRAFAKEKFDFEKVEAKIHDSQRDRSLALQKQGLDSRLAGYQGEVEAIDDVLPDLEQQLQQQSGPDGDSVIAEQIQRTITSLKDRRGRAAGAASVTKPSGESAPAPTPTTKKPKSDPLGLFN